MNLFNGETQKYILKGSEFLSCAIAVSPLEEKSPSNFDMAALVWNSHAERGHEIWRAVPFLIA